MRHRGNHWYVVKEERAMDFERRGFPIKQKHNGKWMVRCTLDQLRAQEVDRKGIDQPSAEWREECRKACENLPPEV